MEWDWDDKIDKTRVEKLLANSNENKSTGSDGMSPYVLKKCSNGLSTPLSIINKISINTGKLPDVWKMKLAPELKNLNYEARLQKLGLTSLEKTKIKRGFHSAEHISTQS